MAVFGLDIANLVADAIQAAGGLSAATLVKTTPGARDPDRPSQVSAGVSTRHAVEAAVETRQVRRSESSVPETQIRITLIAATITPPATPDVNDQVEIPTGGALYTLDRLLALDPAGAAYEFEAK